MVRGFVACFVWLPAAGCSWILDFSDGAIPGDAPIDAPYTQAECDFKEPNDTAATAAAVSPVDTGPAAVCAGETEDHDFYRFTVPAGTTLVEITIKATYRPTGDLDLRLFDKTGTMVLAQSHEFTDQERITCPGSSPSCAALAPDDYLFEVFPGIPGSVNDYSFAI
ncbi:MAG TPA: PPC domain-containing protein, partial [Kofleriaceae bacterium]|nr:PPC domain-containing protein [Kofleriaceae bacterium]